MFNFHNVTWNFFIDTSSISKLANRDFGNWGQGSPWNCDHCNTVLSIVNTENTSGSFRDVVTPWKRAEGNFSSNYRVKFMAKRRFENTRIFITKVGVTILEYWINVRRNMAFFFSVFWFFRLCSVFNRRLVRFFRFKLFVSQICTFQNVSRSVQASHVDAQHFCRPKQVSRCLKSLWIIFPFHFSIIALFKPFYSPYWYFVDHKSVGLSVRIWASPLAPILSRTFCKGLYCSTSFRFFYQTAVNKSMGVVNDFRSFYSANLCIFYFFK